MREPSFWPPLQAVGNPTDFSDEAFLPRDGEQTTESTRGTPLKSPLTSGCAMRIIVGTELGDVEFLCS
jgi:hypothetical protein